MPHTFGTQVSAEASIYAGSEGVSLMGKSVNGGLSADIVSFRAAEFVPFFGITHLRGAAQQGF